MVGLGVCEDCVGVFVVVTVGIVGGGHISQSGPPICGSDDETN